MARVDESAIGSWVRVTQGLQRGKLGIADLAKPFPVGLRIRVINPDTRENLGWFDPEQLERVNRPSRPAPQVDLQPGLDLLMGNRGT